MKRLLRAFPTLMLMIVGCTSFLLSYVAIRDVAADLEAVPAHLAWAVPVCVDGGILAASATIWASSYQRKKRDPLAFLTVGALLATSVVINVSHAGPTLLAKWIAALPPLILLACLEIVAAQHRAEAAEARAEAETDEEPTVPVAPQPEPARPTPTVLPAAQAPVAAPAAPVASAWPGTAFQAPAPVQPVQPAPVPEPTPEPEPVQEPAPRPAVAEPVAAQPDPAVPQAPVAAPTDPAREATPETASTEERLSSPAAKSAEPAPETEKPAPVRNQAAQRPSSTPTRQAPRVKAAPASSGSTLTKSVIEAYDHLTRVEGRDPKDKDLVNLIVEKTGASAGHVRKVIAPLRTKAAVPA